MAQIYKHEYVEVSVYGNVVSLLRNCVSAQGVLLDFGCGYGPIAEPVRDQLGLTYVGLDFDTDGLAELRERGFETHRVDLSAPSSAEAQIEGILAGRPLVGMTIIDTLEHLVSGPAVLALLRRLAGNRLCPLVISVPNVAHHQVAVKLLLGRWDMTEAGLLDHTHVAFFTASRLHLFTVAAGWQEIADRDFLLETSDQKFPIDAVPFQSTPLSGFLRRLTDGANPHVIVNQFVRAFLPSSPQSIEMFADRSLPERPFLSVILRTEGVNEIDSLRMVIDALATQTCLDFEVRLVPYRCPDVEPLHLLLEVMPESFRRRVTLMCGDHHRPADAYNLALGTVGGGYVAFLDCEVIPLNNWVATFRDMAVAGPGCLLQTRCQQPIAEEPPVPDLVETLFGLRTPLSGIAFPVSIFRDLGLRFDSSLPIDEDRDLLAHVAQYCSVHNSDTVSTAVRCSEQKNRILRRGDRDIAQARLLQCLQDEEILLPAGSALRLYLALKASPHHPLSPLLGLLTAHYQGNTVFAQLVRSHLLGLPFDVAVAQKPAKFFLSVIARTVGLRPDPLRDMLLSLAGQTCQEFEVIIVLHKCVESASVSEVVASFPLAFRQRVRLVDCNVGGRASPLNHGVQHARGNYIAFVDDDDFVFGHWVETFKAMAAVEPGKLLRTVCARQETASGSGAFAENYAFATSWFSLYPTEYDLFVHLMSNQTPFLAMAFPAFVFSDYGLRFDDLLTTTEDWELTMRVALLCGVHSSDETTCVYRWWTNARCSATEHSRDEWDSNRQFILDRVNASPLLLPPGSLKRIMLMFEENQELCRRVQGDSTPAVDSTSILQQRLDSLLASASWRISRPLRLLSQGLRRARWDENSATSLPTTPTALIAEIEKVRNSYSWEVTAPLRLGKNLLAAVRRWILKNSENTKT
jgi:hypothetical protein